MNQKWFEIRIKNDSRWNQKWFKNESAVIHSAEQGTWTATRSPGGFAKKVFYCRWLPTIKVWLKPNQNPKKRDRGSAAKLSRNRKSKTSKKQNVEKQNIEKAKHRKSKTSKKQNIQNAKMQSVKMPNCPNAQNAKNLIIQTQIFFLHWDLKNLFREFPFFEFQRKLAHEEPRRFLRLFVKEHIGGDDDILAKCLAAGSQRISVQVGQTYRFASLLGCRRRNYQFNLASFP